MERGLCLTIATTSTVGCYWVNVEDINSILNFSSEDYSHYSIMRKTKDAYEEYVLFQELLSCNSTYEYKTSHRNTLCRV